MGDLWGIDVRMGEGLFEMQGTGEFTCFWGCTQRVVEFDIGDLIQYYLC